MGLPRWQLPHKRLCSIPSKHPAKLEEPFAVPGIGYAASEKNGAENSFRDHAPRAVCREARHPIEVGAIHFAHIRVTGHINAFAHELRQRKNFLQITGTAKEVLIAEKFVQPIPAEVAGAAEEKLRHSGVLESEGGAALGRQENRAAPGN